MPLIAQVQQATIESEVIDSSGLPVPGATVDIRDVATNQHRSAQSDTSGSFRITSLSPGNYDVRVELSGFAPYEQRDLNLTVGQIAHLRVTLAPASVTETVSVTAQPPALNVTQTATTTVVDTERIEELPVRSRNYLEFVLLAPGVARSGAAGASGSSSSPGDSGFSFAGLRPRSNMLEIPFPAVGSIRPSRRPMEHSPRIGFVAMSSQSSVA